MNARAESQVAHAAAGGSELGWGRTPRLALREFRDADLDALVQMHQDRRLREYLVDDYPLYERGIAQLFLQRMALIYRRYEGLGIWHASGLHPAPQFVGWFNLMPMAERPGEVELGSRLLPFAWGSGLALEGGELLLDHAFDDLGLSHVWGICHPDNRSAQAVLAALGFAARGDLPYDGGIARHHRIDLNAWRRARNTPRGIRLRRALRARTGRRDSH